MRMAQATGYIEGLEVGGWCSNECEEKRQSDVLPGTISSCQNTFSEVLYWRIKDLCGLW